jgi:hypothetical protein
MTDGLNGQIHVEIGPVEVVRLWPLDVQYVGHGRIFEPGELREGHEHLLFVE